MARHVWTASCRESLVDRETGSVALVILSRVELAFAAPGPQPGQPAMVPLSLHIVSFWVRSDPLTAEQTEAEVQIIAPGGAQIATGGGTIDLASQPRCHLRIVLSEFPFVGDGWYSIRLRQRGAENWAADVPIEMLSRILPPPAANL